MTDTAAAELPHLSTSQVAVLAGVSYRQLDYWIRVGYVSPAGEATPGTGTGREWDPPSIRKAVAMAAFVGIGFSPSAAAKLLEVPERELTPAAA